MRTNYLKEVKREIDNVIERHEKFSNAYFWSSGGNASQRRNNEKRNYNHFVDENLNIDLENNYSESCKNVYYKGIFYLDGERVTIAKVKKLSEALSYLV